jgi:hypothetical protein
VSYFPSAPEAARALGVPLLLRVDPDPRAFRRHDWLGTLAAPAASAACVYARAVDEATRADGPDAGVGDRVPFPPGAIWVTGPFGSMGHLPWAVGLADHLARTRGRAGLLDRESGGPLRTLARPGRKIPVRLALAENLLGGVVEVVNTDLEGVFILLPGTEESRAESGTADAAAGDFPLVLTDGLPESLDGPYPGAEGLAGVILVASFRDHSRFELDAVVRRLRETGHRLLGLVAIGPDVSDAQEAAALRAEGAVRSAAARAPLPTSKMVLPAAASAPPASPAATPALAPPATPAVAPVATPAFSPAAASTPVTSAPASQSPESPSPGSPPAGPPPAAPPPAVPPPAVPPPAVPRPAVPPQAVSPPEAPVPVPGPGPEPSPASVAEGTSKPPVEEAPAVAEVKRPEAGPGKKPEMERKKDPQPDLKAEAEPPAAEPASEPDDRPAMALLSNWDRVTMAQSKRRRRTVTGVTVLLLLLTVAAFYGVVLRPRLDLSPLGPMFAGKRDSQPADVDSGGAPPLPVKETRAAVADSASVADDSAARAADSTAAVAGPTVAAPASSTAAADFERTGVDSARRARDEIGDRVRRPGGTPAQAESGAVRPVFRPSDTSAGASDTTVALPGGGEVAAGEEFVIHLTSFKLEAEAEAEVLALARRGIEARAVQVEIPFRGSWYRIVTGNFATFAEAESVALRLQAEGKVPYAHIAADGGRGRPVPVGTLDRERP